MIIPLLKCKSKDPADVNNYRPIAIATTLFKVLDNSTGTCGLQSADSQFGFKQEHGTVMAIFVFKQTVDFYHNQDAPAYMRVLDTKKGI